jgi:hypothetical protein
MKSTRLPFALMLFAALPWWLGAADAAVVAPPLEKVYVQIDSPDLIFFHHYRLSQVDGHDLILNELKNTAAAQARFADYPGELVVLDAEAKAPAGAPVLLLYWNRLTVTASLIRGGKEDYLGVVSRTPYDAHPDYINMQPKLNRGLPAEQRDEDLRARTQMNLYQALRLLRRQMVKA